jgi:hypothetical protein
MPALIPRVVLVTRPSEYDALLARYGTRPQAKFALESIGQSLGPLEARHERLRDAFATVSRAIPREWRTARLDRSELDRFIFEPDDLVVPIGQDGLVANVAKYLRAQRVVGINPDPAAYEGVLVRNSPARAGALIAAAFEGACVIELRTMAEASFDDGQRVLALNEIFVGHRSHQSARYRVRLGGREERQSSSGLIVATGTGSTGWARSIRAERRSEIALPAPGDPALALFVREAFPGSGFETSLTEALVGAGQSVEIVSEMGDDGVVFGDGIEDDRVVFGWGSRLSIRIATRHLRLVVDEAPSRARAVTASAGLGDGRRR